MSQRRERTRSVGLFVIFLLYVCLTLRVTLLKNGLFYHIGVSQRSVSLVPLNSIVDMFAQRVPLDTIARNVLGNVLLLLPLGALLPALFGIGARRTVLTAFLVSLSIETVQFALRLGISDVDDLICNTLGAALGYGLFVLLRRRSAGRQQLHRRLTALFGALGAGVFCYLLVFQTSVLWPFSHKTQVENAELVDEFIDAPCAFSGHFFSCQYPDLTLEQSVSSASQARAPVQLTLTPQSEIYLCRDQMRYFFQCIASERIRYEALDVSAFLSDANRLFGPDNPVRVWSRDGRRIDRMLIVVLDEG